MSEEDTTNDSNIIRSNNEGFQDYNALQIRLNSEPVLNSIEYYLKGRQEYVAQDSAGNPELRTRQISNPKANDEGIHSLMAYLRTRFNTQVVQGHFENFEELNTFISYEREDLVEYILHNMYDWEIEDREAGGIIDIIIGQIKLFLSRTVGDGERKSYSNTIQHRESSNNTVKQGGGGFKFKVPGFR